MKFSSYNLTGELGEVDIDVNKILGKGATATIYAASVQGQPYAAKIYHQNNKVDDAKIKAMLANEPANVRIQIAGGSHPQLAWPFALIRGPSGRDIGYLMPVVDLATSFSLDHYYDQTLIKKLKSPSEDALSFKLEIARNLTLLVADLHDHGHFFIDFKPQNIRVSLGSHVVTLVDCDGFSIAGPDGKRYPADLVSTDYIAPEASKGNLRPSQLGVAQDLYALAVILFQLFNRGTHPFQGILNSQAATASTNDDKAAQGLYPHGLIANLYIKPRPQSIHNFLDDGLRHLFDKALVGGAGERPPARDWADCLDKLLRNKGLARCDMYPYDLTHMRFNGKQCPTCYLAGIQKQTFPSSNVNVSATLGPPISALSQPTSTPIAIPSSPASFPWLWAILGLLIAMMVVIGMRNQEDISDQYKRKSDAELCAAYQTATREDARHGILVAVTKRGYKKFEDMCPDVYFDQYKSKSNGELCEAYPRATSEDEQRGILTVIFKRGYKAYDEMCKPAAVTLEQPASHSVPPSSTPLKVAFAYVGPVGDGGWTFAHDLGRKALEKQFGARIVTVYVENVPESADAERVIRDMADQGNKLIFGTTFGYMEPMLKVAAVRTGVNFHHATGYKTAENMSTYDSRTYEGAYLAGVIAGDMTKSNTLGVVASVPIPEVIRNINSFTLGAQSSNPKVKTRVFWVNEWFNPPKETEAATNLINSGADVLFQNTDSPAVLKTAQEKGKRAFGWDSDMTAYGPKAHLASAITNWGPYYIKATKDALEGKNASTQSWWGVKEGAIDIVSIAEDVPTDTRAKVEAVKAGLKDGSFVIWKGPIVDNTGKEQLAKDTVADDRFLGGMGFYLRGVEGRIPGGKND